MNKKGVEWLNLTIVVMSAVIVVFAAVALTVIYDVYHPDEKSVWENKSVNIPGIKSSGGTGSSGTGPTKINSSGGTGSSGNSGATTNLGETSTNSVSCTNDCSSLGIKKCVGNSSLVCGNFDSDSCLEWGNSVFCSNGCSNGECLSSQFVNSGCTSSQRLVTNCGVSLWQSAVCSGSLIASADISSYTSCQAFCGNVSAGCYRSTGSYHPSCECYSGNIEAVSGTNGWGGGNCTGGQCANGVVSFGGNSNNVPSNPTPSNSGISAFPTCSAGQKLISSCALNYSQNAKCSGSLINSSSFSSSNDCLNYCGSVGASCYTNTGSYSPNCKCYDGNISKGSSQSFSEGWGFSGGQCTNGRCVDYSPEIPCNDECSPEYAIRWISSPLYERCARGSNGCLNWTLKCQYGVLQPEGSCLHIAPGPSCSVDSDCSWRCPSNPSGAFCGSNNICGCLTS
jgi:hypothetical protein